MSDEEGSVTCPHCGEEFNVTDRLRAHIEAEVRIELHESIHAEAEEMFAKRLPPSRRRRQSSEES